MAPKSNEDELLAELSDQDLDYRHQRLDVAPVKDNRIGKWTVVALVLNRTIGSGIFLTPHRVLAGAGCVGGALMIWTLAALLSLCGLYVWLECSLSMPQQRIEGEDEPRGVPRSGGEKNFLEFMFPNAKSQLPHLRTTCSWAIMFILMYNLSGNALSFAIEVMTASGSYKPALGDTPPRGTVIGIAIAILSGVIVLHTFSRRGGIMINNAFAIIKVCLLVTIICLGIAKASGRLGGSGHIAKENFTQNVWKTHRSDVSSWSNSLLLCCYANCGFEQPFYVLAETKSPRKHFPKYTVLAWVITAILFLGVNVSYLLVVSKNEILPQSANGLPGVTDLATLFFSHLFQDDEKAARAMAGIIAVCIFGNLWVMTFTAARVKQEIAKEGILPLSLTIATSYRTPYGFLREWYYRSSRRDLPDEDLDRAPTAAFGLHWLSSIVLIAVTAPIKDPRKSYYVLVSLFSYTVVALVGCWVAIGLAMVKIQKSKWQWHQRCRYLPWLSPAHVIIYALGTAFILIACFVPPTRGSPFHESVTGLPYYLVPVIGITAPFWGLVWYGGLLFYGRFIIRRRLVVSRTARSVPDPDHPDEYVQVAELIDHTWEIRRRRRKSQDFDEPRSRAMELKNSSLSRQRQARDSEESSLSDDAVPERRNGNRNEGSPSRGGGRLR